MNPTWNRTPLLCFAAALLLSACGPIGTVETDLDPFFERMAKEPLAMNPVQATIAGYHTHEGLGEDGQPTGATVSLDELLGDYSSGAIQERLAFYQSIESAWNDKEQTPERTSTNRYRYIDYGVVENRVRRGKFRWEEEQPHVNDPSFYVELIGNALFTSMAVDYASESERVGHVIARLGKVPGLIDQAKQNLGGASELEIEAAVEETRGVISLIRTDLPQNMTGASGGSYDGPADAAVAALEGYIEFLENELSSEDDWRMGGSLFAKRVQVLTDVEFNVDETLAGLQAEYDETYDLLMDTARPIHRGIYGNQRPPNDFALMRDILDVVSDENRLRSGDGLLERVQSDLEEVKGFMQAEEVVAIPSEPLAVSDTPPFLRDANPVSAFIAPPVLDPSKGARFWVTPIPANWSRAQTLAKLREYNNYKLKVVALDGFARYVQGVVSAVGSPDNNYIGPNSKLIRNVDPNQGYARGWNWYLVDSSVDLGFQSGSPEFKLNWYKYKLEFLSNAILDIKLHTQNLSLDEAREMLRRQVFMETGAIDSAVRRIQLTPTNSTISYVGAREWDRVKDFYQETTTDFSLQSFHGKALAVGPMPASELTYATTEGADWIREDSGSAGGE